VSTREVGGLVDLAGFLPMPSEPERRRTPAEIDVAIHRRIVRFAVALAEEFTLQDVDPLHLVVGLRLAADRIAQQSKEASADSSKRPTPSGR